jgi:hypothetical protein
MENLTAYIQKMHSALNGGGRIKVSTFVHDHALAEPVLHTKVNDTEPDIGTLVYGSLRLPMELWTAQQIVLGQSDAVFQKAGIDVTARGWTPTKAVARNRKCASNQKEKQLAAFVASVSDVEDIVTIMTALYIEIMKLHKRVLDGVGLDELFDSKQKAQLREVFGDQWSAFQERLTHPFDWEIQLLAGSSVDYARAIQEWWINIAAGRKKYPVNVYEQPVYFVSSNSHSLMNVFSGFPLKNKKRLLRENAERVEQNRAAFEEEAVPEENILYYLSRFSEKASAEYLESRKVWEKKHGLYRIAPYHHIDIDAQVFSVRDAVKNKWIDPRIRLTKRMRTKLAKSNALIVNIAYPLGMAAYRILKEVSENVPEMRGVYIMGKAAALNAGIGDITIPHGVYDHHTGNHIFVYNDFNRDTFDRFVSKNSILDAQTAATVRGTYLQNDASLRNDFSNGRTIVEMEAAPYLNRLHEMIAPTRYPMGETFVVNTDFRLGMAYYVSDTPYRSDVNLGVKRLTWEGLNGTYAISLGIAQDIFNTEVERF